VRASPWLHGGPPSIIVFQSSLHGRSLLVPHVLPSVLIAAALLGTSPSWAGLNAGASAAVTWTYGSVDLAVTNTMGLGDTLADAISAGPPHATLRPVIELPPDWSLGNTAVDPWSPNGRYVALRRSDGLYVLDLDHLGSPPRQVLDRIVPYHVWSPDGNWLLCRVQTPEEWAKGFHSLVAVPVDSGVPEAVIEKADIGPFVWASDGRIHFWYRNGPARGMLQAPVTWQIRNPLPQVMKSTLVWIPQSKTSRGRLRRFTAELREDTATTALSGPGVRLVSPNQAFNDGSRFLVSIHEDGKKSYSAVVDRDGKVLNRLAGTGAAAGVMPTSVSPDGRYVIGYAEDSVGESVTAAPLFLGDSANSWWVRVDSDLNGVNPRFSPSAYLLAFEDPVSGKVHVCAIEINAN
jgi:hypothetical protein